MLKDTRESRPNFSDKDVVSATSESEKVSSESLKSPFNIVNILSNSSLEVFRDQEPSFEWQIAQLAVGILQNSGYEAYFVGGAVRDILLGHIPKDFDIATNAQPSQVEATSGFEKSQYHDTAQAYGVTRVVLAGVEMEVATFRRDVNASEGRHDTQVDLDANLEDDVWRRDFSINALAFDPVTSELVDYVGGLEDLDNKAIRFVGDGQERIHEDPLRILRAVRFKNRLGFGYDEQSWNDLEQAVSMGEVMRISGERIRDEITAILRTAESKKAALEDLDKLGILAIILPEFCEGKGVEQGMEFHAEGDVWTHQLLIMEALPKNASDELIWAALLHDIGKPTRRQMPQKEGERITFYGHAQTSKDLARSIMNRLKFSNAKKDAILWLIHEHINISQLPKMKPANQKKMMNKSYFSDLVELHRADGEASYRTLENGTISREKPQFREIEALWEAHKQLPPEVQKPDLKANLGIDGAWVMSLIENFNQKRDGKLIGLVITTLQEQYANGELVSADQARTEAVKIIEQNR